MNWIIASVPFWFIGLFMFGAGCRGLYVVGNRPDHPKNNSYTAASMIYIVFSGLPLTLAAWLVS